MPRARAASAYDLLTALAADGPAGLRWADRCCPTSWVRSARSTSPRPAASFYGFTLHHGKGHFVRAVLEAVAFMLRRNVELLAGAGRDGRRDPVARRRRPQRALEPDQGRRLRAARASPWTGEDAAIRGDAMLAGVAAGALRGPRRGRRGDGRARAGATSPIPTAGAAYDAATPPTSSSSRPSGRCSRTRTGTDQTDRDGAPTARAPAGGDHGGGRRRRSASSSWRCSRTTTTRPAHMRPAATAAAQEIADALAEFGDVVHAGLVEEEHQAAAAARLFNAEDVDIIVAIELAYTKGIVPARCFIDTTAPGARLERPEDPPPGRGRRLRRRDAQLRHGRDARAHRRPAPDRP